MLSNLWSWLTRQSGAAISKNRDVGYLQIHRLIEEANSISKLAGIKKRIDTLDALSEKTDTDEYMIQLLRRKWERKFNQWKQSK